MPDAIPWREFWVAISGVIELAGATMILFNRMPRLGAWLIVLFLVPVTITVQGVLMVNAPDEAMRQIQLSFFPKGNDDDGRGSHHHQLGVARR